MLQFVRDSASTWLIKLVLWTLVAAFVGTIFLVWGYGDESGERPIASVGESIITRSELQDRYQKMVEMVRQQTGEVSGDYLRELELEKTALQDLISEQLLYNAAVEAGFKVSDEELQFQIPNMEAFQIDGRFDRDRYFAVLRANNMTPPLYEKALRREMLIKKISMMVTDSVHVGTHEIREAFVNAKERVNAKYMALAPSLFRDKMDVTDTVLTTYFNDNQKNFEIPEERQIAYVFADPKNWAGTENVSDKELNEYYENNLTDFREPEKVKARHILFAIKSDASPEFAQKQKQWAETIKKEIDDGADFVEMVKKHSDGPTAEFGGDLGWFGRGEMVPEFENAVFAMEPGTVSDPIKTDFGYHLIMLEDKQPERIRPFEEASIEIKVLLGLKKNRKKAKRTLADAVTKLEKNIDGWKETAPVEDLDYSEHTVIKGRPIAGVEDSLNLVNKAFDLDENDLAGPIETDAGYYYLRLVAISPARIPTFDEVKDKVEAVYRTAESRKIAESTAHSVLARLRGGETIDTLAKELGSEAKETGLFYKKDDTNGIPVGPKFVEKAFEMKQGQYDLVDVNGNIYILKLLERNVPGDDEFEKQKTKIAQQLLNQKQAEALMLWRKSLRQKAEREEIIDIEPGFL